MSSHLLIRRTGEVVQYVPLHRRAWHAGKSSFRGRDQCNDFSVGIELEGTDDLPYYERPVPTAGDRDPRACAGVCRLWRRRPIVGHSDVAPGRKTDPGPAFDWARLHAAARAAPRRATPVD